MSKIYREKKILIIATRNLGKLNEFQSLLSDLPFQLISQPKDLDIAETGSTFIENARLKAIAVANKTKEWALADDSGLCVNALDGAPGIHSARYAINDDERIKRLLKELVNIKDRNARFCTALCLAAPDNKILLEVEGFVAGFITEERRGINGFGYDSIFEEVLTGKTFAEMSHLLKQRISHRAKALSLLRPDLIELIREK